MTLQSEFFEDLGKKGRSSNTLKNYKTDLDCFNQYLKEKQGSLELKEFSIAQTVQYGQFLEQKYNSDNSRRRRVQALRIFFDFLVENGLYDSNPVRKIPSSPKFLDIPRPTSFVDIKTLWQHLLEESQNQSPMTRLMGKRNQVAFLLVYGGGLKVSDLSQLKKDQIFLDAEEGPRVLITPAKRDPYTIVLPKVFTKVYLDYMEDLLMAQKESQMSFDHILFNANAYRILSGGLSPRGLEIIFEELRNKILINSTPKSLRQACIFKWLHQGVEDGLIKEWLGLAPSYSLKLYKEHLDQHVYDDQFLWELYEHYLKKDYSRS